MLYSPTLNRYECNSVINWIKVLAKTYGPRLGISTCIKPEIANGSYNGNNEVQVGATLTAQCDQGFELSGNEDGVITCEDNFGFNKELECIPATCDLIATEDNNILDNVYAIVGVVKTYQCDPGFGPSTTSILCTVNGFIDQINPNQKVVIKF